MDRITNIYKDLFENPVGRISRADYWIIFFFQYAILFVSLFVAEGLYALLALLSAVTNLLFSIKGIMIRVEKVGGFYVRLQILFFFSTTLLKIMSGDQKKTQ